MVSPCASRRPSCLRCNKPSIDRSGRDRALNAAHWRKLAAGERAFEQDQEAEAFFVLEVGRLKVTQVTPEGQEIIVRYIGPKEMFGCVAVCGGLAYPGTATLEPTRDAIEWFYVERSEELLSDMVREFRDGRHERQPWRVSLR